MQRLVKISIITGVLFLSAQLCAHIQQTASPATQQLQLNCSMEELENLVALAQADPTAQPKSVSAVKAWLRRIGCVIILKYLSAKEYLQVTLASYWAHLIKIPAQKQPTNIVPSITG